MERAGISAIIQAIATAAIFAVIKVAVRYGQLHEKTQRSGLLLAAKHADGDERKEKRDCQVEGTEGRHQHAVERRKSACHRRRIAGGCAGFAIERRGLEKTVPDERTEQDQHRPERATIEHLAQLLGEQGAEAERDGMRLSQVSARNTSSSPAST